MAAGLPDAHFITFDLSQAAVTRGQALVDAAGLTNVEVVVGDILDWANSAEGSFDYVIAHGLYASAKVERTSDTEFDHAEAVCD